MIGGSTVQGRPWETETAFSSWLQLSLQICLPERKVEVINCGGVSYASYRIRFIVDEVLGYDPDLLIVCTGHNEFLEQRTYRVEKSLPGPIVWIHRVFSFSRSYQWLRSQVLSVRSRPRPRNQLGEKVITRLDYENGLELFDAESLQRSEVRQHFGFNIRSMLQSARDNNVKTLVLEPVANLKDCYPFKPSNGWIEAEAQEEVPEHELQKIINASENGSVRSADLNYVAAKLALKQGRSARAKELFAEAINTDVCPLRMTSSLRDELRNSIAEMNSSAEESLEILYLNLQELCESISPNQIVGNECLVDHVHPTIATHKKIAIWITQELQDRNTVQQPENWETEFATQVEKYQSEIDFGYYQRGRERLESVLKWSRGQAINPIRMKPRD